jgi:hypothetical protein
MGQVFSFRPAENETIVMYGNTEIIFVGNGGQYLVNLLLPPGW